MDRAVVGSQAFNFASAFNANIGAWNTARVTTLYSVSAASAAAAGALGLRCVKAVCGGAVGRPVLVA